MLLLHSDHWGLPKYIYHYVYLFYIYFEFFFPKRKNTYLYQICELAGVQANVCF